MESTREIIPCDFRPFEKTFQHALHTTHISHSSVVDACQTSRRCDVALTVTASHDEATYAQTLEKRVWSLVTPEVHVQKSVGSDDVVISTSKPLVQEKNYVFPQSCCWRNAGEMLILCRAFSTASSHEASDAPSCAERFELYIESQADESSDENTPRKSLLATAVFELEASEAIHSMFSIPHRTHRVKRSSDGQTAEIPQESEVPCMLIALISTHGKVFLWKVSHASEFANTQPVVPDGAELVLSLFEKLSNSHRILSCVQTSASSILLMSDAHLAVLKIDASSAVSVFTRPLDHLPDPSSPVTMLPTTSRTRSGSMHHTAPSLAEIAYLEKTPDGKNCIVGTLEDDFTLTVEKLPLQSNGVVIAMYPIQPFAVTKRVAVVTDSELAVYCCRFEGLKIFTMNLTQAVAAVWMPSLRTKRHSLCVVSLAAQESQSVGMLCDFITLRNIDDSSLTGQTSIVYAMQRDSNSLGESGLAAAAAESSLESSETYQALVQAYGRLKDGLKKFPHHPSDSQESQAPSAGSWDEVNTCVGAVEQSLKQFVKAEGRKMLTAECRNEHITSTLCGVRRTIHYVRHQALHAKTLQKKLTTLRLSEKGSADRKETSVVMDGKYPRRTIESSDYSPWALRPPH
ncbi:hypothetical protein XU18_1903 [Perkinsela sp. CCAP 1560/4]|nr:hypothetical protein XU18_1903 [Perkinsela sp. CCAP 1560/4]|eukprot:KNH07371.1 hypothetical protein XU18_1903 [Perkinsela sp. CCAP 1560/4]